MKKWIEYTTAATLDIQMVISKSISKKAKDALVLQKIHSGNGL